MLICKKLQSVKILHKKIIVKEKQILRWSTKDYRLFHVAGKFDMKFDMKKGGCSKSCTFLSHCTRVPYLRPQNSAHSEALQYNKILFGLTWGSAHWLMCAWTEIIQIKGRTTRKQPFFHIGGRTWWKKFVVFYFTSGSAVNSLRFT